MKATVDAEQMITPGDKGYIDSLSATSPFATSFEDDGDTGYFYALERTDGDIKILAALQIYVVAIARLVPHQLQIVWSHDGLKTALLVDGVAHAVFDFAAKHGYCRRAEATASADWDSDHSWSDVALDLFV